MQKLKKKKENEDELPKLFERITSELPLILVV